MTEHRSEWRAAHHVEAAGFEYYLPQREIIAKNGGVRREFLFPSYVIIRKCPGWEIISSLKAIRFVLATGEEPWPILDSVVREIKSREDARGFVRDRPSFHCGDRVRVQDYDGPWSGARGRFEGDCDYQRSRVIFSLFGREVTATLDDRMLSTV